jgi:hypothetical protein
MKSHQMVLKSLLASVLLIVLAGCSLTASPTATIAPTLDLQPTLNQVATESAQTVVAHLTMTAPTITPTVPTSTPTETYTPTTTYTPLPPTFTPTRTLIPWTSTPVYTATPEPYACSITSTTPASTDSLKVGTDFDGKWVVKNTGTQAWGQTSVDIKYISGTKFQKYGDLFDLKSDVAAGASYTVIVDMLAPTTAGSYNATWALVQDKLTICTMTLTFKVVN